jgi:glycosyltransferase involved in cell wall biosynthesis
LHAWSIAQNTVADWRLDVFGDGDRIFYEHLIAELKIDGDRCQLHARTNDVEKEYCNSGIFVLSSRYEGFGLVLVEAMATGLPVVSFRCPCGPEDIVTNGEDGILVENGNIKLFASSLSKLMSDEALRQSMSKAALKNVQRFSMEQIAEQWRNIFESDNAVTP